MNAKLTKAIIFGLGAAVGAVVSAIATKRVVEDAYWEACDKEINESNLRHAKEVETYKNTIADLKADLVRKEVVIQDLEERVHRERQAQESSEEEVSDDEDPDRRSEDESEVAGTGEPGRPYYAAFEPEEDEEECEYADDEDESGGDSSRIPRPIHELDYDTTHMDYAKNVWKYYIRDGKIITEDGEYMDGYALFIGEDWLSGPQQNGMVKFIRNNYFRADFKIEFIADFGERHMSTSSDEVWEDDD